MPCSVCHCSCVHCAGIRPHAARTLAAVNDTGEACDVKRWCKFQCSTFAVECEGLTLIADADHVGTTNMYDALYVPETQVEGECMPWLWCVYTDTMCVVMLCADTWLCAAEDFDASYEDGQDGGGESCHSDVEEGNTAAASPAQSGKSWQLC